MESVHCWFNADAGLHQITVCRHEGRWDLYSPAEVVEEVELEEAGEWWKILSSPEAESILEKYGDAEVFFYQDLEVEVRVVVQSYHRQVFTVHRAVLFDGLDSIDVADLEDVEEEFWDRWPGWFGPEPKVPDPYGRALYEELYWD